MNNKIAEADSETELDNNITDKTIKSSSQTFFKWSIVNLFFSLFSLIGLSFNLIALKYSFKTQSDNKAGDFRNAKQHSKLARKCNIITTVLVCVTYLLIALVVLFVCYLYFASRNQIPQKTNKSLVQQETFVNVTQVIVGSWHLVINHFFNLL